MSVFQIRLQKAMDVKNIKPAELSEKSGIGKSSISQWLSGKYDAKQDKICLIAKAMNINPSWLMGADVSMDSNTLPESIKLLAENLEEPRQQNVYKYANHQLLEQNNNVVQLSDYTDNVEHTETVYGAVSAGTGQYLDHEQPEQVVVRGSAPDHDFAVKVVGNSMEPTFNDGQIVYVNKLVDESEIRNNQFVIAEVNGDAFIKKLSFSEDYVKLISLNPNYDDIIIHDYDDFLIRGIVVI